MYQLGTNQNFKTSENSLLEALSDLAQQENLQGQLEQPMFPLIDNKIEPDSKMAKRLQNVINDDLEYSTLADDNEEKAGHLNNDVAVPENKDFIQKSKEHIPLELPRLFTLLNGTEDSKTKAIQMQQSKDSDDIKGHAESIAHDPERKDLITGPRISVDHGLSMSSEAPNIGYSSSYASKVSKSPTSAQNLASISELLDHENRSDNNLNNESKNVKFPARKMGNKDLKERTLESTDQFHVEKKNLSSNFSGVEGGVLLRNGTHSVGPSGRAAATTNNTRQLLQITSSFSDFTVSLINKLLFLFNEKCILSKHAERKHQWLIFWIVIHLEMFRL